MFDKFTCENTLFVKVLSFPTLINEHLCPTFVVKPWSSMLSLKGVLKNAVKSSIKSCRAWWGEEGWQWWTWRWWCWERNSVARPAWLSATSITGNFKSTLHWHSLFIFRFAGENRYQNTIGAAFGAREVRIWMFEYCTALDQVLDPIYRWKQEVAGWWWVCGTLRAARGTRQWPECTTGEQTIKISLHKCPLS